MLLSVMTRFEATVPAVLDPVKEIGSWQLAPAARVPGVLEDDDIDGQETELVVDTAYPAGTLGLVPEVGTANVSALLPTFSNVTVWV
jgi:hypothetical protein